MELLGSMECLRAAHKTKTIFISALHEKTVVMSLENTLDKGCNRNAQSLKVQVKELI
jgi:hypothetical protein